MNLTRLYTKLVLAFAAFAALAACSDKLEGDEFSILDRFNAKGEAYMNLSFDLPTTSTTRAEGTYQDGLEEEYKVTHALVVFFAADKSIEHPTQDQLKYRSAYTIVNVNDGNNWDQNEPENVAGGSYSGRVTQAHSKVFRINNSSITASDRLYAYCIANFDDYLIDEEGKLNFYKLTETPTWKITLNNTSGSETTFKEFSTIKFGGVSGAKGFYMTNAPMADMGSTDITQTKLDNGDVHIVYLPEVNTEAIFPTEAQALARPAAEINLERMAVKVTIENTGMTGKLTTDDDVLYSKDRIRWSRDNFMTECYNVRQVEQYKTYLALEASEATSTDKKRFVDRVPTSTGLYRIFWGEDFNYDYTAATGDIAGDGFGRIRFDARVHYQWDNPIVDAPGGPHNYNYFMENTMNEWGLRQDKTSRFALCVPFSAGPRATALTAEETAAVPLGKWIEDGHVYGEDFYTSDAFGSDVIFPGTGTRWIKSETDENYIEGTVTRTVKKMVKTTYTATATGTTMNEKVAEYLETNEDFVAWKTANSITLTAKELLDITMLPGTADNDYDHINGMDADGTNPNGGTLDNDGTTYDKKQWNYYASLTEDKLFDDYIDRNKAVPYGKASVGIALKTGTGISTTAEAAFTKLLIAKMRMAVDRDLDIKCYDMGLAFYKVLVRHFDDTEVNNFVSDKGSTYDAVYPVANRAQNYLGRYGMVRNTWYTIIIDGIRHLGASGIIDSPALPDDEVDNYLSVKVLVNKWAQRSQHNTL